MSDAGEPVDDRPALTERLLEQRLGDDERLLAVGARVT